MPNILSLMTNFSAFPKKANSGLSIWHSDLCNFAYLHEILIGKSMKYCKIDYLVVDSMWNLHLKIWKLHLPFSFSNSQSISIEPVEKNKPKQLGDLMIHHRLTNINKIK